MNKRRLLASGLDSAVHAAASAAMEQLQAAARALLARRRGERIHAAAMQLQAAARSQHARNTIAALRTLKSEESSAEAAKRVQAHLRGHRERQRIAELRRDFAPAMAFTAPVGASDIWLSVEAAGSSNTHAPSIDSRQPLLFGAQSQAHFHPPPRAPRRDSAIAAVLTARIEENMRHFDVALGQPGAAVGTRALAAGAAEPANVAAVAAGGSASPPSAQAASGAAAEVPLTRVARALSWGRKPAASAAVPDSAAQPAAARPLVSGVTAASSAASGSVVARPISTFAPGSTDWLSAHLEQRARHAGAAEGRRSQTVGEGGGLQQRARQGRRPFGGTKRSRVPAGGGVVSGSSLPSITETQPRQPAGAQPGAGDSWAAELEHQLGPMRRQPGGAFPSGAFFGIPSLFGLQAGPAPIVQPPSASDEGESLSTFLGSNGLGEYLPVLAAEEISLPDLRLLTDEDLKELGLKVGPRARLKDAIKRRFSTGTS